ncbi:endonuclease/exonuclease/phosphatase family protein [Clostridium sp. C8]|uniref:Endonuclease/exonuclease/phosphatase domain-containing protein n=1 Tax=bioreactor metagenome TaxID=1076179 RepID=A0A645A7R4_9ZZZZ|nr:endonuclease/exonuclease/phosphatase family protein [Clostridium sp. C8]KLE14418.1 hypothetical protein AAT22_16770 [Clostridium sp. C8]
MKIISLNINQFLGKENWKDFNNDLETITNQYMTKVIQLLIENVCEKNDIVVLHEVPYKNKQRNEVFQNFKTQLEEKEMVLIPPNYLYTCRPNFISCAIIRKESNWIVKENKDYICSNTGDGYVLYNRAVELYNSNKNIHLLGVHIPMIKGNNYSGSVMWDDIINYYKKMFNQNLIIIGDMNVYAENTIQKRKFDELICLGAIDAWPSRGNSPEKATYTTKNREESRLDYALMTLTAFLLLKEIEIDDKPRTDNNFFTDHSSLNLLL